MGSSSVEMCEYTNPDADYCDSYAGIAYAHGMARHLLDSEGGAFFAYARQLCLARPRFEAVR